MKKLLTCLFAVLVMTTGLAGFAAAHEQKLGALVLKHAWSRETPKGAKTGAAYVTIENTGDTPDQILGVSSDIAAMASIHDMSSNNGVMSMKPAGQIEIPAGGVLELKPNSLHVMLMGLKKPLAEGDTFPVTFEFAKAGKIDLQIVVGKIDSMGEEP